MGHMRVKACPPNPRNANGEEVGCFFAGAALPKLCAPNAVYGRRASPAPRPQGHLAVTSLHLTVVRRSSVLLGLPIGHDLSVDPSGNLPYPPGQRHPRRSSRTPPSLHLSNGHRLLSSLCLSVSKPAPAAGPRRPPLPATPAAAAIPDLIASQRHLALSQPPQLRPFTTNQGAAALDVLRD
ncbi:hypothetical protein CPAR01_08217 [Colletotrichum paranaense]|uniref:Uncharacterized protein n=1 Tax=Colletotrichum paranaense TaxID=1914294 RepID=A0ABQ9SJP3_9PEZI|nr:uncharacterized protein CPAR01_08217 [Colletotrichum paranaense]KAK1538104.1 hypothetical protein CPAR01_08217 [Colletotrichum paranaense]